MSIKIHGKQCEGRLIGESKKSEQRYKMRTTGRLSQDNTYVRKCQFSKP